MSKIVLITGATRGLGHAMTQKFIELGHTMIGCGRSLNAIKTLESHHASPHRFDCLDVIDNIAVAEWAKSIIAEFGPPDLLINNAGIINQNAPLWEVPVEEFSAVVDVNIKGVANIIRHVVPAMIERGSGVIVNFSSGWGRSTVPDVAPYCATKWAIEGLTQSMAQELPAGMAAVPLNPGIINTDMLQSCFGSSANHYPNAEQWSEAAVPFLLEITASDNGAQLTAPSSA